MTPLHAPLPTTVAPEFQSPFQPLPEPLAEIVFRLRDFREGVGQDADEGRAVEGGALQFTRHDHDLVRRRKGWQGYYNFATRSAGSAPQKIRRGGLSPQSGDKIPTHISDAPCSDYPAKVLKALRSG